MIHAPLLEVRNYLRLAFPIALDDFDPRTLEECDMSDGYDNTFWVISIHTPSERCESNLWRYDILVLVHFDPRTRVECDLLTEVAIVVLCNISIHARSMTCDINDKS